MSWDRLVSTCWLYHKTGFSTNAQPLPSLPRGCPQGLKALFTLNFNTLDGKSHSLCACIGMLCRSPTLCVDILVLQGCLNCAQLLVKKRERRQLDTKAKAAELHP
ncbi:hypothetical protein ABBQ38_011426 [Trebouxia sp. C0009 RCD-2024]